MDEYPEVSLLAQAIPDKRIAVFAYPGGSGSSQSWEYSLNSDGFMHHLGATSLSYSETELFRLYRHQHWKVKPFFTLKDNRERRIAIRLVEELVMLGHLDELISEYEINHVRTCEHCHHLMDEGWLVDEIRTFCSDECLLRACPNMNMQDLQAHSSDVDSLAYWPKWED